jgi:hypothetical protein
MAGGATPVADELAAGGVWLADGAAPVDAGALAVALSGSVTGTG